MLTDILVSCMLLQARYTLLLKGRSHEVYRFTKLGLTERRDWFFTFFRGFDDFIMQKVSLLNNVSCLFLSFLLVTSGV
jgi:hypothetical protein